VVPARRAGIAGPDVRSGFFGLGFEAGIEEAAGRFVVVVVVELGVVVPGVPDVVVVVDAIVVVVLTAGEDRR